MSKGDEKEILIAIPIFDGLMALDAVGIFDCVQLLPNVKVVFVAKKPGPYKTSLGYLSLIATASFEDVPCPDIIIVPGGTPVNMPLKDEEFLNWIRKVHKHTMYTTSVCVGSLLLGAAGLLKGVKASCHWKAFPALEAYGAIATNERIWFAKEERIITTGGVTSGIDMGIFLVSLIADTKSARAVQLALEYNPDPPFGNILPEEAPEDIVDLAKSFLDRTH